MTGWVRLWQRFVLGVSANWTAKIGAAVTTGSFVLFVLFELFSLAGAIENPYFDMVVFLTLPTLMFAGLVLVALGWWWFSRSQLQQGKTVDTLLAERFGSTETVPKVWGTRLLWTVLGLSAINAVVLGGVSFQAKHFMDSREFCGTACHVMNPQWVAFQQGPHSGVQCVDCHVGQGAGAFIEAKIGGARQFYHELTNTYSRPIPTPVHQMRPAYETCGRCHEAERDHGSKLVVRERFAHDDDSSRTFSALRLHVGGGAAGGIHWHARKDVEVRYTSVDGQRKEVIWVEATGPGGSPVRYVNRSATPAELDAAESSQPRIMDCTDCHNRTGHRFFEPGDAIDQAMSEHRVHRELPRIKDQAWGLVTGAVAQSAPGESVRQRVILALERHYASTYPETANEHRPKITESGGALADIVERNVFEDMRVEFFTYPDHSGHRGRSAGCFRCHSEDMVSEGGSTIAYECSTCHEVLADGKSQMVFGQARDVSTAQDQHHSAGHQEGGQGSRPVHGFPEVQSAHQ